MSSSARLKYKVVKCTSEDPEYPVSELLAHSAQTKGWQTARFCDFPQEICLQFETPVHLRQIQFLSHQSKISTKIELFTALPPEGQDLRFDGTEFKKLGYLSLDNNERSGFQARELKSVYVDVSAQCLRILFHKCHTNRYNIVNQVGLIALNCLGEALGPDLAAGPPPNPVLARGPVKLSQAPSEQAQEAALAASDEMRYDGKTLERIRALSTAKQRAVEAEDYEEAKRCKDLLARLRQTGLLLRELEDRKSAAVQNEDYDIAKALKVEIERLRLSIERPQAENERKAGGGMRAPSSDHGLFADQGDATEPEWAPSPPPQATAPRGVHQPRMEQAPRGFAGADADGNSLGHRVPGRPGRPLAAADAPSRGGSPAGHVEQAAAFGGRSPSGASSCGSPQDAVPARDGARSPPLPAARGAARVAHSPVVKSQRPAASTPPLQQPPERERSSAFDAANHPLAGVPNVENLEQPEPLSEKFAKEAEPLIEIFGEPLTCCMFSKVWTLRDAALQKVVLDLKDGVYNGTDPSRLLNGVVLVLRNAIPDKNVQVFLSCAPLLHAVCHNLLQRGPLRRPDVQQMLEPMMPLLVDRLGDANARVDKTARDAHIDFAKCPAAGAPFTASFVIRPPKKKTVPPRVFSSRLQLLTALVSEVGLQPEGRDGLSLEPTVQTAMEWFNNSNADVRESAVKLVAACYVRVGIKRIEPYLEKLRQVQREVFDAEFEKLSKKDEEDASPEDDVLPAPQVPPPRLGKAEVKEKDAGEDVDDRTCQFCGRQDPTFTPETVDVHYWRECPMLIQCEFCQQVIEISTLLEHLLEECDSGALAEERAHDLVPDACPLCRTAVGASTDQDWREHLLAAGCPKNPRDEFRRHCRFRGKRR